MKTHRCESVAQFEIPEEEEEEEGCKKNIWPSGNFLVRAFHNAFLHHWACCSS